MKLSTGKQYITRDGQTTGPLVLGTRETRPFEASVGKDWIAWREGGRIFLSGDPHPLDLISEASEPETPDYDDLELRPPLDPKGEAAETKCPLQLLPIGPQHETAWVFKLGAEKYGLRNWRTNQVCASTYYGAMRRHMDQWFQGADLDDESKRHHLAHLIASAMIVMDAAQHGTLEDDRP